MPAARRRPRHSRPPQLRRRARPARLPPSIAARPQSAAAALQLPAAPAATGPGRAAGAGAAGRCSPGGAAASRGAAPGAAGASPHPGRHRREPGVPRPPYTGADSLPQAGMRTVYPRVFSRETFNALPERRNTQTSRIKTAAREFGCQKASVPPRLHLKGRTPAPDTPLAPSSHSKTRNTLVSMSQANGSHLPKPGHVFSCPAKSPEVQS